MAVVRDLPSYETPPEGRWFTFAIWGYDHHKTSPFPGVEFRSAEWFVAQFVNQLIDGRWWFKGSKLGGVSLEVILARPEEFTQEWIAPRVRSGPDRRFGVVDVAVHVTGDRLGESDVSLGVFIGRLVECCLEALEWVRSRYDLPDVSYFTPERSREHFQRESISEGGLAQAEGVQAATSARALEEALDLAGPHEIGIFVPYLESEQPDGSPRVVRIRERLAAVLVPDVVETIHGDDESVQDAAVWILPLAGDLAG